MINENQESGTETETGSEAHQKDDTVTLKKEDYAKLNDTIGSLKRDLKDLKKARTEETSKEEKEEIIRKESSETLDYGQKSFLNVRGVDTPDKIALFKEHMKRYVPNTPLETILGTLDFQKSLEEHNIAKANLEASDTKGGTSTSKKGSAQNYLDKGEEPPSDASFEVRKEYVKLRKAKEGDGRMFYNQ